MFLNKKAQKPVFFFFLQFPLAKTQPPLPFPPKKINNSQPLYISNTQISIFPIHNFNRFPTKHIHIHVPLKKKQPIIPNNSQNQQIPLNFSTKHYKTIVCVRDIYQTYQPNVIDPSSILLVLAVQGLVAYIYSCYGSL